MKSVQCYFARTCRSLAGILKQECERQQSERQDSGRQYARTGSRGSSNECPVPDAHSVDRWLNDQARSDDEPRMGEEIRNGVSSSARVFCHKIHL